MKALLALGTLAVTLAPEIVRLINDERGRRQAREDAEAYRRYDREQREADRQKDIEVARIGAEATKATAQPAPVLVDK